MLKILIISLEQLLELLLLYQPGLFLNHYPLNSDTS
jgi:hypothetical protein